MSVWATPHHDSECSPEVRRIHHDDNVTRLQHLLLYLDAFQLLLHPPLTPSEFLSKLLVRLFAVDIFLPQSLCLRRSFLAKLGTTVEALPELSSGPTTVLFDGA